MQFAEVLTPTEKRHLSRFVDTPEKELALSEKFMVVSMSATLAAGGFTSHHLDEREKPANEYVTISDIYFRSIFSFRDSQPSDPPKKEKKQKPKPEILPAIDWNVPKLALAPIRKSEVSLSSGASGYVLTSGKWTQTFKPSWHTPQFPSRGTAGLNLYETGYSAPLPPIPRDGLAALKDFKDSRPVVLWEADWEKREQYLDPAILVPVWRDLYSVVFTWDLTEAERNALKKASGLAGSA